MALILIIFFICLALTIIAIIISKSTASKLSQFCNSDDDCPSGDYCIPNPEYNNQKQCFPKNQQFCSITPNTALKKCRLNSNDCDVCLNNPEYACIEVTADKPYVWKQGNVTINIPNSYKGFGWCLPNIVNKNITCNEYTSDYILVQNTDGTYEWACECLYPNLFDHGNGPTSDCTHVRACGEDNQNGKLYVPNFQQKCNDDDQCANGDVCRAPIQSAPCGPQPIPIVNCSATGSNCVCHTQWMGENVTTIDPLSGRCECDPKLQFQCVARDLDYYEFKCVPNSCYPNQSTTTGCKNCLDPNNCECCVCPSNTISCPDDIPSGNTALINYCQINGATCLPDPCKTKDVPDGYWNGQSCVCNTTDKSAVAYPNENSPVGQMCVSLCNSDHNPCGDRGTCYVQEGTTVASCCDCVQPYTNVGDGTCSCSVSSGKILSGGSCCQDSDCITNNCVNQDCDGKIWGTPQMGTCRGDNPPPDPNSACRKPCQLIPPNPPIVCPDNVSTCPAQVSSCCLMYGTTEYSCCPFQNGVCCGDQNNHCCPENNTCNIQDGLCVDSSGKKTPWSDNS